MEFYRQFGGRQSHSIRPQGVCDRQETSKGLNTYQLLQIFPELYCDLKTLQEQK